MSIRDSEPILEGLADAIVASDESGLVICANSSAAKLFGWSREELLGMPLAGLMPQRMHAMHEAGFRRYLATHRTRIFGRPVRVPARRRDGVELDIELTLSSVREEGKEIIVASLRDLRDRVELERQILAQQRLAAQNAVMTSFAAENAIEEAAAAALEAIGENLGWPLGTFWLLREGRLRWVASWHAKNVEAAEFEALSRETTFGEGEGLPGRAWQAREPVWAGDLRHEENFPRGRVAAQGGLRAAFAFPLQEGSRLLGVVEFFQLLPQAVDPELLQSVATLGGQIGQCLERIEARADERAATEAAHAARVEAQVAGKRATFLAEAGAALASSLDLSETLRRVAALAVPAIADWCTVAAVDEEGTLRRVAVVHGDPQKRELVDAYQANFPPASHRAGSIFGVLDQGKSILQPVVTDADLRAAAQSDEHLRILRGLGCSSCVMVPMRVRDRPVGVISLMRGAASPPLGEADVRMAEELAHRAEMAVDNARLFGEAQRERSAMVFLAEASALLSSSLDYDITLERLAQLVVPRFADWCSVEVIEEGDTRSVTVAHVDPAKVQLARELRLRFPRDPDGPSGVALVLRTGRNVLYPEISDEMLQQGARDAAHLEALRALGMRSVLIVPLPGIDRTAGALSLVWAESGKRYTPADLTLMEEVGRRAGVAVENARLYRATRESVRARDEFLSIASHELKTPLTSLQLQVSGLRRNLSRAPLPPERLAAKVATIDHQVERLGKLVENPLDVSRASAGPLQLETSEVDLAQLVREVAAGFDAALAAAGCRLELALEEGLVGRWDRMRLAQVITNFISNALKYGPGAPVEVTAAARGNRAVLTVRDHGIGIAAADQRRIFERFARAVSPEHYSGLGLGLWIVRVLVEAMGGTVSVTSSPGKGASFVVELDRTGGPP